MNVNNFVVASSKPWHRDAFEKVSDTEPGKWAYVSSSEELNSLLLNSSPRYIFFLHWNWRVEKEIWEQYECVCFHMTDVPYGRGGSPLQNLILDGQVETKVTALRMVEEMDAGPVYIQQSMSLDGRAEDIYRRSGELCWEMIHWIVENEPTPASQVGEITYFRRRTPAQSELPTEGDFSKIYNFIRMLDAPTYPLAFVEHGSFRFEFYDAELGENCIQARVVIRRKGIGNSHE